MDNEEALIKAFADELGTQMIYFVPRDNMVQKAEIHKKTVIEYDSAAEQAQHYRNLAKAIDGNQMFVIPKPLPQERLEQILMDYGLFN